ncbi:MAG TPA: long-chain-acyl-CoA synthetase [Oceanospirillales bacterium]|nr:long-chain-acyl-CoA synthetase [Oceanospirillales bacterium]
MSNRDTITLFKFIPKLPTILRYLPETIKGLAMTKITDENRPVGLGLVFEDAVKRNPNGFAVIGDDRYYTYTEFNKWSNRIANYFLSKGFKKGDAVAIFMEDTPELLAVILGLNKIGVVCAMINTSQRKNVLVHSINLAKAKVAIVAGHLYEAYDEVKEELQIERKDAYWLNSGNTLSNPGKAPEGFINLAPQITEMSNETPDTVNKIFIHDSAFYIYTSGTTGLPKAVDFNHNRTMKAVGGFGHSTMHLNKNDRMLVCLPFYHSTALAVCWGSVLAGAGAVIVGGKFSASRFWDTAIRYDATCFGYVGELCRYLLAQPEKVTDKTHKIRKMVGNGMRPAIWDEFKDRFIIDDIYEFYASSEGNVGFTNTFGFDRTMGFSPMDYAVVKYDREADAPVRDDNGRMIKVKRGEAGLLIGKITPKTPFDGYTDKEKTKSVILENVFEEGDKYFNTGDLIRDIGMRHAQFVDRTGDTFRWKSENVSTTEVENALNSYPGVVESIVYGVEIPQTVGRCGMAQLNLDTDHEKFNFENFLTAIRERLPAYAVPLFLRIDDQVQQTGTFKYQKRKLKDQAYDLEEQDNPVYGLLPKTDTYTRLTPEIQEKIDHGEYPF